MDGTKLKELGFKLESSFEENLSKTIAWYLKPENAKWIKIKSLNTL